MTKPKIAIIGAGISGLIAAKELSKIAQVTIFDKSRGIGGRMATRRFNQDNYNFHFDHGAQFFTAKTAEFKEFCSKAKEDGIIDVWQARFAEITNYQITRTWLFDDHHPHYVAKPQMNNLCKYLAQDLEIILNTQITQINFKEQRWHLKDNNNQIFTDFDYLILAIPSHQALNLIPSDFVDYNRIKNSKMLGCFALMLGFQEKLNLEFDAALVKDSKISWISHNSSKPDRPNDFTLLINTSNSWSENHMEDDIEFIQEQLISELQKIINFQQDNLIYQNTHRWRYANIGVQDGPKFLFDANYNLGLCGDWLLAGRVECAFLSGLQLSRDVISRLI